MELIFNLDRLEKWIDIARGCTLPQWWGKCI